MTGFSTVNVDNAAPSITLPMSVLSTMAAAYLASHEELCGFVAGRDLPSIVAFVPNVSTEPTTSYVMGNDGLMEFAQYVEDQQLTVFASFHTHVSHPPIPSRSDVDHAVPDLPHQLIIGDGAVVAAYVGDFTLPASIVVVETYSHCIRCGRHVEHDDYVVVDPHYICKGDQS